MVATPEKSPPTTAGLHHPPPSNFFFPRSIPVQFEPFSTSTSLLKKYQLKSIFYQQMSDIPLEIHREILSRLPAETLLRFRCVCKEWKVTIDDPTFIRLHLHRQLLKIQDSSNGAGQLILRGDINSSLYSLSLDTLSCNDGEIVKARALNHSPSLSGTKPPVGSCNGVMLISDTKGYNFLWNPLTSEFHRLPPPHETISKKLRGLYISVSGLGYDCAADDYKVVKIAQVLDPRARSIKSETSVYSLRLDSWRTITEFPYRISSSSGGVFLNGVLHWVSSTMPQKCMDDLIIGLDLQAEDYCVLPLPSQLPGQEKPSAKRLGVLGGCLVLSCYYQTERLDVWLMKEYGVKNSWSKLFSIGALDNIGAVESLRPLGYFNCKGEVLLQHAKKEFVWFNLETKMAKRMRIHTSPATFSSQSCLASIVRLNRDKNQQA